jgi:hypothetical protein
MTAENIDAETREWLDRLETRDPIHRSALLRGDWSSNS